MLLVYFGAQSWWALSLLGLILLLAAVIAIQAHRSRARGGNEELPGMVGEVTEVDDATRRVRVLVRGEVWQARPLAPVRVGDSIRVRSARGLILEVEPLAKRESASDGEST